MTSQKSQNSVKSTSRYPLNKVNSFRPPCQAKKSDKIFEKIKKYLDASQQELKEKFQLLDLDLISQKKADDDPDSIIKTYKNQATEIHSKNGTVLRTYTDKTMVVVDERKNITLVS